MSVLQDRRRVLGPTDTVDFVYKKNESSNVMDSEAASQLQTSSIILRQGVVANAKGSCYAEIANTRLNCAVEGPRPIRGTFKTTADLVIDVTISSLCRLSEADEKQRVEHAISEFVHTALSPSVVLDLYPKSAIGVSITVLSMSSDFNCVLATAVNGASVALADAGISLHDIVTATTIARHADGAYSTYQPCISETSDLQGVVAFMAARDEIVGISVSGGLDSDSLDSLLLNAKKSSDEIRQLVNSMLIQEFKRREEEVRALVTED
jgi:exosome complex component MTR3